MRSRKGGWLASSDKSMGHWWICPDETGYSQAPSPLPPMHRIPCWPAALTLEKNTLGFKKKKNPTHPYSNLPTQKYIWQSGWMAWLFFGSDFQVLSSRHSDGLYCTASQKDRQPSLWATDRPCLDWKDFDGAKRGGGGSQEGGFPAQRS